MSIQQPDAQADTQDRRALLQNALVAVEKMQKKLHKFEAAQREPIAIVGMACRFPGHANTPEQFWQLLLHGVDAVTEVPLERWDLEEIYDPDPDAPGKAYTRWGAFLQNIDQFDANFFGIAPREAVSMDPQQRLLLEVTWEALEYAAIAPNSLEGSRTGVFIGLTTYDYSQRQSKLNDPAMIDAYFGAGVAHSVAAGRLSYMLGLHGPNMAIDTACSSSSVAMHVACQSLRTKESNMAIAGAANLTLLPDGSITTSRSRMMSFNGRCKTFDASADGYVRGEGCAVVVLKRLSDALTDQDNILAVIQGTALNQDGRSNGLTAPNGKAQRDVIRASLENAGVGAGAIGYIETHGTGTTLGDPIEVQALGDVFATSHNHDNPLWIGSVKTNVGHLEAAAGVVGLIKIVLALQHKTIPPHLHFREPNPYIDWANLPVKVPTAPVPWEIPAGQKRMAGLSSFGFSGTNSHMIIAEAPETASLTAPEKDAYLLPLSAKSEMALRDIVGQTAVFLKNNPDKPLADVAYTLAVGRDHFDQRLALLAKDAADAAEKLDNWLDTGALPDGQCGQRPKSAPPEVAFLFTGQGAQYIQMGRQLMETEPVFRQAMERCDAILRPFLPHSLLDIIYPAADAAPETAALIDQTQYTQPALFAIEYALAQLWQSWGIEPVAVMGHSVGEFVAACIAGVFSLEDGLKLIAARGRLMSSLPAGGTMAAVFADEATVQTAVAAHSDQVSIAAINGPNNVVISGAGTAVTAILDQLAVQGINARPLVVSHAFHSPLMDPILDEFADVAASITFSEPQIELVSNVSGDVAGPEVQTAVYWRNHVRAPVRFADAMQTLSAAGVGLFVECGPQPTLSGMGQRCLPDGAATFVPSLRPGKTDAEQMMRSLGQLYAAGVSVNWPAFHAAGGRRMPLPTYPFQRQRYWLDLPKTQRALPQNVLHPLLHEPMPSPLLEDTVYISRLSIDAPAYLNDHRIFDVPLFPGTGYLEVALAAARLALGVNEVTLAEVQIQEAMVLLEEGERLVQTAVSSLQNGQATVRIFSQDENGKWQQHVTAVAQLTSSSLQPALEPLDAIIARCKETIGGANYYKKLAEIGLAYGPAFRGIRTIRRRDGEALAEISLPEDVSNRDYALHPALLDACFQVIGAALPGFHDDASANVYVPVGVTRFHIWRSGVSVLHCQVILETISGEGEALRGSIQLRDKTGELVALVDGIQLRRVSRLALQKIAKRPFADLLYKVNWELAAAPELPAVLDGHWLLLADEDGIATALAEMLHQRGATTTLVAPTDFDPLAAGYEEILRVAVANNKQPLHGVIHLWGQLSQPDTQSAQQWGYGSALTLAQALLNQTSAKPRLWLVTRGAQSAQEERQTAVDPAQSTLWGFARTLAVEAPEIQPVIMDLDPMAEMNLGATAVLAELVAADGDDQIVWRDGKRYVARLQRYQPDAGTLPIPTTEPFELFTPQQGVLDNINVRHRQVVAPGANEMTLDIIASGLNFRDVLNALGMYPGPAGALGNECVGVVTAVGTNVTHLSVGDTVMALVDGAFASAVTANAAFAIPIPANLSPVEAATIPITFLTAYYGLHHLAKIRPGDRILIHAAAGGVGMAAVQLAQQAGAEIFGTAGSPEKRALLASLGVQHVMNSRTLDFADEIMTITNGRGVDIVLNALADEFIDKSFAVLADNGRFLEIGKRGIWTHEQVAAFNSTLAYFPYDLANVARDEPHLIGEMMAQLKAQFTTGVLRPLPLHTFPINRAIDAFRFMSQARHIGKIVLTKQASVSIRGDATYLVTGGLGGLGLAVVGGLVERGARHLLLIGRSVPSAVAQGQIDQLRAAGVNVAVAQADIAQKTDVQRVLEQIAIEMPPLRGVVHAAGVLADGRLLNQSWSQYETVMAAKVLGSEHLHQFTRDLPLDFFVCFSAGAALLGSPGQINYSAANAYMDGLVHARRAAGLPGLSINWGAWADVGMAAGLDARTRAQWQSSGIELILPAEGVALMFQLLDQPAPQVAVLPMDWSRVAQQADGVKQRQFLRKLLSASPINVVAGRPEETLLVTLAETPAGQRFDLLQAHVQKQVALVLGLDPAQLPDPQQGLTDIGMDSLMAVELSNRLRAGVGQSLPTTLAFEYPTIWALTRYLAEEVLGLEMAETAVPETKTDDVAQAILTEIETLSESEIEDSLLKELEDAGY